MTPEQPKTLEEYLREVEDRTREKPEQVRDGMEIYVGLWRRAIDLGVVQASDQVAEALRKVDQLGGLYSAVGEERNSGT